MGASFQMITIQKYVTGETNVDAEDIRITLKGLEYLSENSIMQKMYKAAKGITDLIPQFLPPVIMTGGIFMGKNRMKLYFEWRTAVEMAVVLYGILIVIITWLKVFEENGTQVGT